MHDSVVHGSCDECTSFVAVFPPQTGCDDWGYCVEQTEPPTAADVAPLYSTILAGDRAPLRQNQLGLYRTEPDDACDFFRHRD
jgi:hypothetical protein